MLMAAASAHAGDFAQAAENGFGPSTGIGALIALGVIIVGTAVFVVKFHFQSKVRVMTGATALASAIALQAGDFADAADRGYRAWSGRSNTAISGINAIGSAASSITPEGTLQFLASMNSNTPLRDAITAQGNYERGYAAGTASMPGDQIFGSPIAIGPLSGTSGNYRWGTTLCNY
jgi:hypothetical protein